MSTPTETADRHRAHLTELGELGMALAREAQARAMAASEDDFAELSLAFQRVSRSVRQTFALEARLEREQVRAEREAQGLAARQGQERLARRRAQVRHVLREEIWNEYEAETAEAWTDLLNDHLSDHLLPEDFAEAPLEACVDRLRADLGLPAANAGDPGDGPPGGGLAAPDTPEGLRRSSA